MDIVEPRLERYLHGLLPEPDPVLREMERLAEERRFPIVGPLVGRFLAYLVRATGAEKVLEMGSGFGYSGLWFARTLPPDGEVVLTEYDPEDVRSARRFFADAGLAERARFLTGDALELVRQLEERFDILLIDVDKEQYPQALELALERVVPEGTIVVDNVLWHGRVVDEEPPAPSTRGVLELNRMVHEDPRLTTAMIPLRDGLAVCRFEG